MENLMLTTHVMTSIRENYGAHDWDGTGEVPHMWKDKGGEDYIISGAPSVEDAEHFVEYRVCSSDEYSTEEVVSVSEVAEGFRTDLEEFSNGRCEAVRIDWAKRFESRYCKGGWNWLAVAA
jgi:hypothetical protein